MVQNIFFYPFFHYNTSLIIKILKEEDLICENSFCTTAQASLGLVKILSRIYIYICMWSLLLYGADQSPQSMLETAAS